LTSKRAEEYWYLLIGEQLNTVKSALFSERGVFDQLGVDKTPTF
jgi:hypothetical protein